MSFIGPFVDLICVRAFCDIYLGWLWKLFERMERLLCLSIKLGVKLHQRQCDNATDRKVVGLNAGPYTIVIFNNKKICAQTRSLQQNETSAYILLGKGGVRINPDPSNPSLQHF